MGKNAKKVLIGLVISLIFFMIINFVLVYNFINILKLI